LKPTIWITRTAPAAFETARRFEALGLTVIVSPLLEISPPSSMPAAPPPGTVLIFTSRNGVRAFADLTGRRDWPVITVGDATAEEARRIGFADIRSAQGNSSDVIELIKSAMPKTRELIHYAGEQARGDIAGRLGAAGYHISREVIYRSTPVRKKPDIDRPDYIALYSPMAARILAGLDMDLKNTVALAISAQTADMLVGVKLKDIRVADRPNEDAMLELIIN